MNNAWIIKHDDLQALEQQKTCFYCKRFFCEYLYNKSWMVCSKKLPKCKWLVFLMRKVKPTYTCNKFELRKKLQKNLAQR